MKKKIDRKKGSCRPCLIESFWHKFDRERERV